MTTEHPLTEARVQKFMNAKGFIPGLDEWGDRAKGPLLSLLRAAFDAGREHERAQTRPDEVTDEAAKAVGPGPRERITNDIGEWVEVEIREGGYSFLHMGCGHMMGLDTPDRAALSAALTIATPADPHHDSRPWQDCTRDDIQEGDLVEAQVGDALFVGVAGDQDEQGDWRGERGTRLTYGDRWPLRRIPAPTPSAVEVEMPGVPCVLTDVQFREALATGEALWTGLEAATTGFNGRAIVVPAHDLLAFTLPDGTRARRDGECADGTPRFVKEADQ